MASTPTLNVHQLSLFTNPTLKFNPHKISHPINPNPFKSSFINRKFSQIQFVKPSLLSQPLPIAPSSPPRRCHVVVCSSSPVWGPQFSGAWAPSPTVQSGRADFRVWSKKRGGSKGGKSKRSTITLECTKCTKNRYTTEKHSVNTPGKLELSKYCPKCRLHTPHKQIK